MDNPLTTRSGHARLTVHAAASRSSGEVGVVVDGRGVAAGVELDADGGAALDLGALVRAVAADPSRPCGLQVRVTLDTARPGTAVFRRVHVMVRLEPAGAEAVVAAHGGGASGCRSALVAAVDRLSARLRRDGVGNHMLDAATLAELIDGTVRAAAGHAVIHPGEVTGGTDLDRVVASLLLGPPGRSIVSVGAAASDGWALRAAIRASGPAPAAGSRAPDQPALAGRGAACGPAAVLPLGGRPGDASAALRRHRPRRRSGGSSRRPAGADPAILWTLPPSGVVLGRSRDGSPLAVPLLTPAGPTRVGVVGGSGLGQFVASTLLQAGCGLTVVTDRPELWQRLAAGEGDGGAAGGSGAGLVVTDRVRSWPPAATPGPWALITDLPQPPSTRFTKQAWCCVVHVSSTVPEGSPWWRSTDLVLGGPASRAELAAWRPAFEGDGSPAEDEFVALYRGRTIAFTPGPGASVHRWPVSSVRW